MSNVDYPTNVPPIVFTKKGNDLARNLKTLSEALSHADSNDDIGEPNRYQSLFQHLTGSQFLNYENNDVRVYLACCIADLLRIFAPTVPTCESSKLKEIFILVIDSLKGLANPSGPTFRKCFYLLENISTLKTLHLCNELPSADANEVTRHFLKTSLEVVKSKAWAPQRERSMEINEEKEDDDNDEYSSRKEKMIQLFIQLSTKLLSDLDHVENQVLDVLFFYIVNPQKSNFRESYNIARAIFQSHTSLESAIETLLIKSLVVGGFPEECELVGNCKRKLHEVIIELHLISPELVNPVIPQLSGFLRDEDFQSRLFATKTMSCLLVHPKCDIVDSQPEVWKTYLNRQRDTSREIREEFAKQACKILLTHSQVRGDLSQGLLRLLSDAEDEVRLAALTSVVQAARSKLEAVNETLILACCQRMVDKKPNIRHEAFSKLLTLHCKVVCGENYTESDRQVVTIIPEKALCLYLRYTSAKMAEYKEEGTMLERYFYALIIPRTMDPKKRIPFMVNLYYKLNQYAREAFTCIISRNAAYRRIVREILDLISKDDKGLDKAKQIDSKIERVASVQTDVNQFTLAMRQFTNILATEPKSFNLTLKVVGLEYTLDEIEKSGKELLNFIASRNLPKEQLKIIRYFIERFVCFVMDNESAHDLVRTVINVDRDATCGKTDGDERIRSALSLLLSWTDGFPHLFLEEKTLKTALSLLTSSNPCTIEVGVKFYSLMFSKYADKMKERACFSEIQDLTWRYIASNDPYLHHVSKLACKLACKFEEKEVLSGPNGRFSEIIPQLVERLNIDDPGCLNALRVLSFINSRLPTPEFAATIKELIPNTILKLILSNRTSEDDPVDLDLDDQKELKKQKMPKYTLPKIHALKLLCRCLNGDADYDPIAAKTLNILVGILKNGGNIHCPKDRICNIEKAVLRGTAGSCVLQICNRLKYCKMLNCETFSNLAYLIIDPSAPVRSHFEQRLIKGLRRTRLPTQFLSIFSLVPTLEIEGEAAQTHQANLQRQLVQTLSTRVNALSVSTFPEKLRPFYQAEYAIAFSILLLSENPLYKKYDDIESLRFLQESLWFVIEAFVINKSFYNFELIFRSLEHLRLSTNAQAEAKVAQKKLSRTKCDELNRKLWALTDLAIIMILYRGKIQTKNDPVTPMLPKSVFGTLKNGSEKVFAPESMIEEEKKRKGRIPHKVKRPLGCNTVNKVNVMTITEDDDDDDDENENENENEDRNTTLDVPEDSENDDFVEVKTKRTRRSTKEAAPPVEKKENTPQKRTSSRKRVAAGKSVNESEKASESVTEEVKKRKGRLPPKVKSPSGSNASKVNVSSVAEDDDDDDAENENADTAPEESENEDFVQVKAKRTRRSAKEAEPVEKKKSSPQKRTSSRKRLTPASKKSNIKETSPVSPVAKRSLRSRK
ncbi:unnamed protein product [Auanema sp. JU1783]|nr:unnamed protein product [Auanema sp. JU1783]